MDCSGVAEKCLQVIMYMGAQCETLQNVCVELVNHMLGLDVSAEHETVEEVNIVTITPVAKDGSMTRFRPVAVQNPVQCGSTYPESSMVGLIRSESCTSANMLSRRVWAVTH
jgi:hypothetical protein